MIAVNIIVHGFIQTPQGVYATAMEK